MLLTIGMIVKNEERYLAGCLEAISPILEQVDSELIIADTGSTDHTVEIAKRFTDNVFFFEWCDDFSKARNFVLKKAKGKWFLAVDADEFFEDTGEIISFFNSGAYKEFHSASYIQRNSNDKDMKRFSDFRVTRITEIYNDTRYISAIHEQIYPIRLPTKHLPAVALHYGYITQDNEEAVGRKMEEYKRLIENQIEIDPTNSKNYYDISNVYYILKDYEKASESCDMGLRYAKASRKLIMYSLFLNKVLINHAAHKYEEALDTVNEYFQSRDKTLAFDLEMYCYEGHVHYETEKFREAIDSYLKYIKILNEYKSGLYHGPEINYYMENSTRDSAYKTAVIRIIRAYVILGEYQSAQVKLGALVEDAWYQDPDNVEILVELEMSIMKNLLDYARFPRLYGNLNSDGRIILREWIEYELHDAASRQEMMTALLRIDEQTEYFDLIRLRYGHYFGGGLTAGEVEAFISGVKSVIPLYADAVYFAVCYKCRADILHKKLDFFELDQYLLSNKYLHFSDWPLKAGEYCGYDFGTEDDYVDLWRSQLMFLALPRIHGVNEEMLSLCDTFARAAYSYAQANFVAYVEDEEKTDLVPQSILAGCCFYSALFSENVKHKISALRKLIKLCPQLGGAARIVLHAMESDMIRPEIKTDSEFDRYAETIKANIYHLAESGKTEEAYHILDSYEKLCPNDADITDIKNYLKMISQ
jgi:glycosyltransferase involved in cell wall biosynthesis